MSHLSDPTVPSEDTERFTLQPCPHCSAVAIVPLSLATTACESCGGCFEVAPLHAVQNAGDLQ